MPQSPAEPLVLSIDQGTTNSKAVLVDGAGQVRSTGSCGLTLATPRVGWVEQDPEEIWTSTLTAVARCLTDQSATPTAITISNQRETVLAWRRSTGEPLGPAIGWQDTRTSSWCAQERIAAADPLIRARTGLRIDPMFSAPKIRWLLDHVEAPAHDVCIGTIDSWLIWCLTSGARHVTEAGNAARTLGFDVIDLDWSDDLLEVFTIPRTVLPDVVASFGDLGRTVGLPGVPDQTPIVAVLADSHAALYAQGCRQPGTAKATFGTGSSVMSPATGFVAGGSAVPTTLAWVTEGPQLAREGNIVSAGAALDWTTRLLGLTDVPALLALAGSVTDSGGVIMVPALAGLGAPHWDRAARATVTALTQTSTSAHLARAVVDAVAHQICDVVECINADTDATIAELRADGGATASTLLMQIQADLLGRPVAVAEVAELSAVGAALLGLAALGSAVEPVPTGRHYQPQISADQRESERLAWAEAVGHTRTLSTPHPRGSE